jgi:hypothetical protein
MLNITVSAGNDSDVTFSLLGNTYAPVLKAIYLEYTIPAALANVNLCLAARVMSVTSSPALTIQTVNAPLLPWDIRWYKEIVLSGIFKNDINNKGADGRSWVKT